MNDQAQTAEREQPDQAEQFAHLASAGREALTDEMVARLGESASQLMELLDQVNRAELDRAIPTLQRLVDNGDLERVAALARLVGAGEEALTDEMIGRLAGTASDTLDLLDRVNAADLKRAVPTLQRMVDNGDLERLADVARLYGSAQEALTDEMIGRLAGTASDGLDLLDRLNRSNLERILPTIERMVENGDMERVASLARLFGSIQEALTDEMVSRLAGNAAELMALADRLQSSGLLERLIEAAPALNRLMAQMSPEVIDRFAAELPRAIDTLDRMQQMHVAEDFLKCLQGATEEMPSQPAAKGGWMGLLSIMKQKETQEMLQFVVTLGKHFRQCRLDRHGGG
jgi:Asp-tRNA(Asn)/Glu-tRNA(Gln) amidotransferase C subunit